MPDVIAILCSDIHLSDRPPVVRSAEPDWYAAMKRPLDEIRGLMDQHSCPLIVAGDIFDRWNSSAALINFAIDSLPRCYAIPGQHDLPNHRLDEIDRSAYATLTRSGVAQPVEYCEFPCWGFPWGQEVKVHSSQPMSGLKVAVIHSFFWSGPHAYTGAPRSSHALAWASRLKGYDVAVFGDNHQGFVAFLEGGIHAINCGTLMRRKIDEIDYRPMVGLLHSDGRIESHCLDTSQDKFITDHLEGLEGEKLREVLPGMESLLEGLRDVSADSLDFRELVDGYLRENTVGQEVREVIKGALEGDSNGGGISA